MIFIRLTTLLRAARPVIKALYCLLNGIRVRFGWMNAIYRGFPVVMRDLSGCSVSFVAIRITMEIAVATCGELYLVFLLRQKLQKRLQNDNI